MQKFYKILFLANIFCGLNGAEPTPSAKPVPATRVSTPPAAAPSAPAVVAPPVQPPAPVVPTTVAVPSAPTKTPAPATGAPVATTVMVSSSAPTSAPAPSVAPAAVTGIDNPGMFARLWRYITGYKPEAGQYIAVITYAPEHKEVLIEYHKSVIDPEAAYGTIWKSLTNKDIPLFLVAMKKFLTEVNAETPKIFEVLKSTMNLRNEYNKVKEALGGIAPLLSPVQIELLKNVQAVGEISAKESIDYGNLPLSENDFENFTKAIDLLKSEYSTKEKLFNFLQKKYSTKKFLVGSDSKGMIEDIARGVLSRLYSNSTDIDKQMPTLIGNLKALKFTDLKPGESIVIEYYLAPDVAGSGEKKDISFKVRTVKFKPPKPAVLVPAIPPPTNKTEKPTGEEVVVNEPGVSAAVKSSQPDVLSPVLAPISAPVALPTSPSRGSRRDERSARRRRSSGGRSRRATRRRARSSSRSV